MIIEAETGEQIEAARTLFREYEAWLGIDLCFQSFKEELADLPGKYAAPSGRLLLAVAGENVAGCIALRRLDAKTCEMKRLYLRAGFRGLGLGSGLIERVIEEAKRIGYKRMRLDTLPDKMPQAVRLYYSYGFRQTSPYYENPFETTLFMKKQL